MLLITSEWANYSELEPTFSVTCSVLDNAQKDVQGLHDHAAALQAYPNQHEVRCTHSNV